MLFSILVYLMVTLAEFLGPFQKNPTTLKSQLFFPLVFFKVRPQCLHFGRFLVIWLGCPQRELGWEEVEGGSSTKEGMDESFASPCCCWNLEFPSVLHFLQQN